MAWSLQVKLSSHWCVSFLFLYSEGKQIIFGPNFAMRIDMTYIDINLPNLQFYFTFITCQRCFLSFDFFVTLLIYRKNPIFSTSQEKITIDHKRLTSIYIFVSFICLYISKRNQQNIAIEELIIFFLWISLYQ